jgi:hypothetical protein
LVLMPRQQVTVGERETGGLPGKSFGQFWWGGGTKEKLLQQDVFSGALDAAGLNVCTASNTKPMSGRDSTELNAFQVEWCVATVADNTGRPLSGEGSFAGGAGGSF